MISLLIGSPWHGHCLKTRNEVAIDYTATPLHCYTATPLHRYTATPLHRYTATLLHCYSVTLPHCYTATLLHCHTATLLHCYTATPLHRYSVTTASCMDDDDAKRKTLLPDTYPHKQTHIYNMRYMTYAHCKQSKFSCLLQSCCPPLAPQEVVSTMTLEVHYSLPLLRGGARGGAKGAG